MYTAHDLIDSLSADPGQDTAAHYAVLYSIARFLPGRTVVEIGVDDGSTTLPLLLGVAHAGGVLHSVDPAPCAAAVVRAKMSGYAAHWRFHRMPSAQFAAECPDGIDLVLIDGDHSYEGVKADWEMYAPKVRVNGMVAFHDKENTRDFPGIARLINDEIALFRRDWEQMTLPYGFGLTLCRKLG